MAVGTGGQWGEGYLCSTNHTISLTTRTTDIKMANAMVGNVSAVCREQSPQIDAEISY